MRRSLAAVGWLTTIACLYAPTLVLAQTAPDFSGATRDGVTFEAHVVARSLPPVSALAALPDGRVLVADAEGQVRVIVDGLLQEAPVLAWPGVKVHGLAVDTAFLQTHWIYMAVTIDVRGEASTVVLRFREAPGRLSEPAVLVDDLPGGPDIAGSLRVGSDGFLYLGTADRLSSSAAQDLGDAAGKILRLTSEGRPGSPMLGLGYVHAWGFADARVFAWDAIGRWVWQIEQSADGQTTEINRVEPGGNYGWAGGAAQGAAPRSPVLQWTPGARPIDAVVYDGRAFPGWQGDLFVAASDRPGLVRVPAGQLSTPTGFLEACLQDAGYVQAMTVAADGSVYLAAEERDGRRGSRARLLRIVPRSGDRSSDTPLAALP